MLRSEGDEYEEGCLLRCTMQSGRYVSEVLIASIIIAISTSQKTVFFIYICCLLLYYLMTLGRLHISTLYSVELQNELCIVKEAVVAKFNMLPHNLLWGTDKRHE
jgi:hypothetical protein